MNEWKECHRSSLSQRSNCWKFQNGTKDGGDYNLYFHFLGETRRSSIAELFKALHFVDWSKANFRSLIIAVNWDVQSRHELAITAAGTSCILHLIEKTPSQQHRLLEETQVLFISQTPQSETGRWKHPHDKNNHTWSQERKRPQQYSAP